MVMVLVFWVVEFKIFADTFILRINSEYDNWSQGGLKKVLVWRLKLFVIKVFGYEFEKGVSNKDNSVGAT